jgi:AraC-like DNA-binding protein
VLNAQAEPAHTYHSFRSPALEGVEMVRAHHRGPLGRWQFVPMTRISCLLAGTVRLWSHGREEWMRTGEVVINCPGAAPRVAERLTPTSDTLTLYITPALFSSLCEQFGGPRPAELQVHLVRDPQLVDGVLRLASAIDAGQGEREALVEVVQQLSRSLGADGVRTMPAGPLRPEIAHVRRILEERFAHAISLEDLAQEAGLSKFHLLRLFRVEVGTTPHAYRLHLRISRAREMLDKGESPVEVALACGFADQPHFTRSFKRIVGLTPAVFRRIA